MFGRLNKDKWSKGELAKTIVIFCIKGLTSVLGWAIAVKTIAFVLDRSLDLSDVLVYAGSAYGGELLLLAFKRVFAKDNNEDNNEMEE